MLIWFQWKQKCSLLEKATEVIERLYSLFQTASLKEVHTDKIQNAFTFFHAQVCTRVIGIFKFCFYKQ